jgi:hypothetical protein
LTSRSKERAVGAPPFRTLRLWCQCPVDGPPRGTIQRWNRRATAGFASCGLLAAYSGRAAVMEGGCKITP